MGFSKTVRQSNSEWVPDSSELGNLKVVREEEWQSTLNTPLPVRVRSVSSHFRHTIIGQPLPFGAVCHVPQSQLVAPSRCVNDVYGVANHSAHNELAMAV